MHSISARHKVDASTIVGPLCQWVGQLDMPSFLKEML